MTVDRHRGFAFGPFRLEPGEGRLFRGDEIVPISPKPMSVLTALVVRAGQPVTREQLLSDVWKGACVEDSNITVQVMALRRALGDEAAYIETLPGQGYLFNAPVTEYRIEAPVATAGVAAPTVPGGKRWRRAAGGAVVLGLAALLWINRPLPRFSSQAAPLEDHKETACCTSVVRLPSNEVFVTGGLGPAAGGTRRRLGEVLVVKGVFGVLNEQGERLAFPPRQPFERRVSPTLTVLNDGRVLIAGGRGCPAGGRATCDATQETVPLDTAELFDPVTRTIAAVAGGMRAPHAGHTATLLPDGTVLIVGGYREAAGPVGDWGTAVELFDPAAPEGQQFRALNPLTPALVDHLDCDSCRGEVRKADHVAVLLSDGSVLIAGGWRGPGAVFGGALKYRVGQRGVSLASPTGGPFIDAAGATGTRLGDDRVLFAGGVRDHHIPGTLDAALDRTLIYETTTEISQPGPRLSSPREGHTATLFDSTSIVIAGGLPCAVDYAAIAARGPMVDQAATCAASATADIVTIDADRHAVQTVSLLGPHAYHAAVLLADGHTILIYKGLTATAALGGVVEGLRIDRR